VVAWPSRRPAMSRHVRKRCRIPPRTACAAGPGGCTPGRQQSQSGLPRGPRRRARSPRTTASTTSSRSASSARSVTSRRRASTSPRPRSRPWPEIAQVSRADRCGADHIVFMIVRLSQMITWVPSCRHRHQPRRPRPRSGRRSPRCRAPCARTWYSRSSNASVDRLRSDCSGVLVCLPRLRQVADPTRPQRSPRPGDLHRHGHRGPPHGPRPRARGERAPGAGRIGCSRDRARHRAHPSPPGLGLGSGGSLSNRPPAHSTNAPHGERPSSPTQPRTDAP
jgi:hypothetical protein